MPDDSAPKDPGLETDAFGPVPRTWERLASRIGADYRIFKSRYDQVVNPRTDEAMERVVLQTPDWVNVVGLTDEDRIIVVRQHRFGTQSPTIEIPGGMVDPGEEPLEAAQRELLEETGFTADSWTSLGSVAPNPAFLDNRCHHFLAKGCRGTHAQALDGGEDIVVTTMSMDEMVQAIHSGAIDHALVLTAVVRLLDLRTHGQS